MRYYKAFLQRMKNGHAGDKIFKYKQFTGVVFNDFLITVCYEHNPLINKFIKAGYPELDSKVFPDLLNLKEHEIDYFKALYSEEEYINLKGCLDYWREHEKG